MDYTVSLLTTAADCQAAINIARAEKENLDYKRMGLSRQRQSATLNAASIEAELAAVNAELEVLQQILNTVQEGQLKEETRGKFKKADYKKFLLENKKANYGALSMIEKEYDLASNDKVIAETVDYINALENRMKELS